MIITVDSINYSTDQWSSIYGYIVKNILGAYPGDQLVITNAGAHECQLRFGYTGAGEQRTHTTLKPGETVVTPFNTTGDEVYVKKVTGYQTKLNFEVAP